LQNEIDQIKEKLNAKEKQNKELIDNMKKEAIDAKVKLADSNYENDKKYMKLKKQFEKLLSALESFGVTVKEIK
jgi:N-dimethylarginine dimethylaminohydrolase